jgi:hypothetical protein
MGQVILINSYAVAPGGPAMTLALPATQQDANHSDADPADSYAGWRFNPDGTVDRMQNTSNTYNTTGIHDWGTPNTSEGALWEIMATVNSGSVTAAISDSTGVWLALSSERHWARRDTASVGGAVGYNITIDIREIADTGNSDTQTYTATVEVI